MSKLVRTRAFWCVILLGWMIVIFYMSSQPANESSQLSGGIVSKLIAAFFHKFDSMSLQEQETISNAISFIVRKTAHFIEYFILGVLTTCVLTTFDKYKHKVKIVISILFCVLYAVSDEIHQLFVPGRACRIRDICIDSTGSIVAIILITIIIYKKTHKLGERNAKKEIN